MSDAQRPVRAEPASPRATGSLSEEWLERSRKRMAQIDALPPEIRQLVHEENWTVIYAFLSCGVKNHRHIRHLISTVREGGSIYSNTNGPTFVETVRAHVQLRVPGFTVAPLEPSDEMIRASMAAVAPYGADPNQPWLSKYNKHKARLRAALQSLAKRAMPQPAASEVPNAPPPIASPKES